MARDKRIIVDFSTVEQPQVLATGKVVSSNPLEALSIEDEGDTVHIPVTIVRASCSGIYEWA